MHVLTLRIVLGIPLWYETYTDLVLRIEKHLTHLRLSATKFNLILNDHIAHLSMQTYTIFALTALVNMHSLLANALVTNNSAGYGHDTGTQKEESQRQTVNAAVEIVSISETFRDEDYEFLESPITVSPRSTILSTLSRMLLNRTSECYLHS